MLIVKIISFIGLTLIIGVGCIHNDWQDPIIEGDSYYSAKDLEDVKKNMHLSIACADIGWRDLKKFKRYYDQYYLKEAQNAFNECWRFDPQNYNAYWGWAVILGLQASNTVDSASAERYLKKSVEFFQLANGKNIPPQEKTFFILDWCHAYNGLGAFYKEVIDDKKKSHEALDQGKKMLMEIIAKKPNDGRAYYLLSINYFYRDEQSQALYYIDKAIEYNYTVDKNYLEQMEIIKRTSDN